MTKAFCPGHITCFFVPMVSSDIRTTGSLGVGIKLDKGATVTLEERTDGRLECTMDGTSAKCPITETAIRKVSERGFDVTIENDIPVSQGFGMSAAGSIAAAMCAAVYEELPFSYAFEAANESDIEWKGGLGDVAAILCKSHVPMRERPGIPPYGKITDSGLRFERASLVLLEGELPTGSVLGNAEIVRKIKLSGTGCLEEFIRMPSEKSLFSLSRRFSRETGLESDGISGILDVFPDSCMCMLGRSVFVDRPADEVRGITGSEIVECSSSDVLPFICKG